MPVTPAVALVLPCYNPLPQWADGVVAGVRRLQTLLPAGTAVRVYLVNDGSTQGVTPADVAWLRCALPQFTYLHYRANRGKGHALRTGVAQVTEPICLFTDVDFSSTLVKAMPFRARL